jgi:hypothetical protein
MLCMLKQLPEIPVSLKYEGQNWPPAQGPSDSGIVIQKIHVYLH